LTAPAFIAFQESGAMRLLVSLPILTLLFAACGESTGETGLTDSDPLRWTSASSFRVAENEVQVSGCCRAVARSAPTYSLVTGPDSGAFAIDPELGGLTFLRPPDYDVPRDADRDSVYEVRLSAETETEVAELDVAVTVLNIDEPPVFDDARPSRVVEDGQVATGYVAFATDPENRTVTYGLVAGGDGAQFTIDPSLGIVRFAAPPNANDPRDVDRDNVYRPVVTARTDSGDRAALELRIEVVPSDSPPEDPDFEDCPDGWEPATTAAGTRVCEPRTEGTAVSWACPNGWEPRRLENGDGVCEPWPETSPVDLTPCPDGWRTRTEDDGATVCDPFPDGIATTCAPEEAVLPGEPGCVRIGTPCPADGWPSDLPPTAPTRYVQVGAAPNGDGSRSAPYQTLDQVPWPSLAPGTIVALGAGQHRGSVDIPDRVTRWGACAAGTSIRATTAGGMGTLVVTSSATVRNLAVVDSALAGIVVSGLDARLRLRDVRIDGADAIGVLVRVNGALDAEGLIVRDTEGGNEQGVVVESGGQIVLRRALLDSLGAEALLVTEAGSTLVLENVLVRDSAASVGNAGAGLVGLAGAAIQIDDSVFAGNRELSVYVQDPGTSVVASHLVATESPAGVVAFGGATVVVRRAQFRETSTGLASIRSSSMNAQDILVRGARYSSPGVDGNGLVVDQLATAILRRAVIEEADQAGVLAYNQGVADVSDVIVRPLSPDPTALSWGMELGGTSRAERVLIEGARTAGVQLADGLVDLADVVVRGTTDHPLLGPGLRADGQLDADRLWLQNSEGSELEVIGGEPSFEDIVLREDRPRPSALPVASFSGRSSTRMRRASVARTAGLGVQLTESSQVAVAGLTVGGLGGSKEDLGPGIRVAEGSGLTAQYAVVTGSRDRSVEVSGRQSTADLLDSVVRDTESAGLDGTGGFGLHVSGAARATLRKVWFPNHRGAGIAACGTGSSILGQDVVVGPVTPPACAEAGTCSDAAGYGLAAGDGGAIDLLRFTVEQAPLCGAHVNSGGLDLESGRFSSTAIGVCLDDPSYDLDRIAQRVDYSDNPTPIDSSGRFPSPCR
jgi:hypothetical protein